MSHVAHEQIFYGIRLFLALHSPRYSGNFSDRLVEQVV
jgi:hypothetical protein